MSSIQSHQAHLVPPYYYIDEDQEQSQWQEPSRFGRLGWILALVAVAAVVVAGIAL